MWQYVFIAPAYLRLAEEETENADIFLERTYSVLNKALVNDISNAEIYNNLAWAFAVRKVYPQETLEAAQRAHELAPEQAHIMDTLAEAYFALGDYEKAIQWEKEALKKDPQNAFYKAQLKKFQTMQKK